MSRLFVTGGAGFIGSYLCKSLTDAGHTVFAYDALAQYRVPTAATYAQNIAYRFQHLLSKTEVLRGDTRNPVELRRAIAYSRPERIIHLAALPLAEVAFEKSEEAFASIVTGTVNLLEILRDQSGIERLTFVSSSMVYGDFVKSPAQEDMPTRPKEIYGSMKLAAEVIVTAYSQRYDIPLTIVRPTAVYGPADNNRRVLSIFIEKALAGEEITIGNGGSTVLDFSFVEDVADGMRLVTMSPEAANETFNISRGEGRSLLEAVDILKERIPDLRYRIEDKESFHPRRGAMDISKARALAGYEPRYSLEEGLARCLEHLEVKRPRGSVLV
jgi:UDP-glucose 4-epimerase